MAWNNRAPLVTSHFYQITAYDLLFWNKQNYRLIIRYNSVASHCHEGRKQIFYVRREYKFYI